MKGVTLIPLLYACITSRYAQTDECGLEKFWCRNGECISREMVCDGIADCSDSSDETQSECTKAVIQCPEYFYARCKYGACIPRTAICDGMRDCVDNSDETLPQCNTSTPSLPKKRCFSRSLCDSGQCIYNAKVCDGTSDCADGSDETIARCEPFKQSPCFGFRCAYGACITNYLKCNGVNNCVDGSDEDPNLCRERIVPNKSLISAPPDSVIRRSAFITDIRRTTPYVLNIESMKRLMQLNAAFSTSRPLIVPTRQSTRPTTESTRRTTHLPRITLPYGPITCIAPPQPQNGRWRVHEGLCTDGQTCVVPDGTELPLGSHLIYSCNEGYRLNGSADMICNFQRKWHNIPECIEIRCESLNTVSTEATCTYRGYRVSCDSSVLPKTRAIVRCRNSYRRESDRQSEFVTCNNIGNWDPEPIRCVPACGRLPNKEIPLIFSGYLPNITDFPWHASLYRGESKEYICGASIIKENLLITAAHCVYDEQNKRIVEATGIYIATGNIYRDYDFPLHDENIVQKRQVKNIYMCYFIGKKGNYGSDIAILEINRPFELSAYLVPICIDLFNDLPMIKHGDVGKMAGFGRASTTGNTSTILQALSVPYVSIDQCRSAAQSSGTEQFIILQDKFCAGLTNGSSACDGDSGSGLVFFNNNLWYLYGIVSTALGVIQEEQQLRCNNNLYTIFTKISSHVFFIRNVMLKVERREQPTCTDRIVLN